MNFATVARSFLREELRPAVSIDIDTMVSYVAKGCDLAEKINFSPGVYYPEKEILQVDAEQGDDHVVITQNPHVPIMESTLAQELFDMEVSVPDTFVSKVYCTYTGKVAVMPMDHFDHYSQTKLSGDSKNRQTIVVDLPALRSVVNVSPQVKMKTSSLEGRLNYISRAIDYSRGTNEEKVVGTISLLQDVTHCVMTQGDKYPYLPSYLGGYDKPCPFFTPENLERSLFAYKRGRYRKLVYTVLSQFYGVLYKGEAPSEFLQKIKSLYSGYQTWFVNYKRNFPLFSGKLPRELWKYKVPQSFGQTSVNQMVLRRLTAEGVLVSEQSLIVANEVQSYFKSLLSEDLQLFREAKSEVEKRFSAETRISQTFNELTKGEFDVLILDHIEDHVREWAANIRISDSRLYRNAFGQDVLFWRDALDEIYLKSPLKVTFPLIGKRYKIEKEQGLLPLYGTDINIEGSLEELVRWMKGDVENFPFPPSELLEDDDVLLAKITHLKDKLLSNGAFPAVLLVTNDSALCKLVNESTSVPVVRLPPEFLFIKRTGKFGVTRTDDPLSYWIEEFHKRIPGLRNSLSVVEHDTHVFTDFGSVEASATTFDLEPYERIILHKEVRSDQIFEFRKLANKDRVSPILGRMERWPTGFIFDNEKLVKISEFSRSEDWRERKDRRWFNPMSIFNRSSRKKVKANPVLIHRLRAGMQESIFPATEVEWERLKNLPNS